MLPEGHEGNHVISSPDHPLLAGLATDEEIADYLEAASAILYQEIQERVNPVGARA